MQEKTPHLVKVSGQVISSPLYVLAILQPPRADMSLRSISRSSERSKVGPESRSGITTRRLGILRAAANRWVEDCSEVEERQTNQCGGFAIRDGSPALNPKPVPLEIRINKWAERNRAVGTWNPGCEMYWSAFYGHSVEGNI